jgi:hypothetical protein
MAPPLPRTRGKFEILLRRAMLLFPIVTTVPHGRRPSLPRADWFDPHQRTSPPRDDHRFASPDHLFAQLRETRLRLEKTDGYHAKLVPTSWSVRKRNDRARTGISCFRELSTKSEIRNPKQIQSLKTRSSKQASPRCQRRFKPKGFVSSRASLLSSWERSFLFRFGFRIFHAQRSEFAYRVFEFVSDFGFRIFHCRGRPQR